MIKLPAAPDPLPPKNLTVGGPQATGPELHPPAPVSYTHLTLPTKA